MSTYEEAMQVMSELFAKDYQFAMATVKGDTPSVRFVDTFYDEGAFYLVTYSSSQKVQELNENSQVALCNNLYRFDGEAYNLGHPLLPANREIREKLIEVFEPWYFIHNNENDENMCYIRIELNKGFFCKGGVGYKLSFKSKEAEQFPFNPDIVSLDLNHC
jgi:general stress protein 26